MTAEMDVEQKTAESFKEFKTFKDLDVWKEARRFRIRIYILTKSCPRKKNTT
jgi:hypothetical protein